ncbi:hypothetical protein [Parvimonas micra]|uniref:hypothetical protein n=1 Tax=Parvimonas micra TaxID=33033 RepID=UPI0020035ED7|nr:hypothetical protein [Parvimonas micra]MCK6129806.1 hypothetical protein [Parvimonas micra]MCK6135452.1 hypothetical protein [Parvimonas micra]MCK6136924.1 hypothetical protein [Parvimonas micra]MCK6153451.1 hypothetical protein [Parvimonas micra]
MKKGNVLLGTIGAIIGSLAGVALYVGVAMLKVFSSWSGAVALYCAIFMYTLFSRKLTKLGVVISIIVSCASMILAEVIVTSINIANRYHFPFFEVFKNFLKIYPKITNKFSFWIYPVIACAFVLIGGFGYLVGKNKNDVELIDNDAEESEEVIEDDDFGDDAEDDVEDDSEDVVKEDKSIE